MTLKRNGRALVPAITCPHCWFEFPPEDALFVARHQDLHEDDLLGRNEYLRFRPRHFTVPGEAVDPKGEPTSDLACPHCRLPINMAMLELPGVYFSIVGATTSGKSYFLTSSTFKLRELFPSLGFEFGDADDGGNKFLHDYEQILFTTLNRDKPVEIARTYQKDQRVYTFVNIDGSIKKFSVPLQFIVKPLLNKGQQQQSAGKVLILYDNSGEDFRPGRENEDSTNSAAILHLSKSEVLLMLFDTSQDARFLEYCHPPQQPNQENVFLDASQNQELILKKAARLIRSKLGIPESQTIGKPLVVIVPKFDLWSGLKEDPLREEPYSLDPDSGRLVLRMDRVQYFHEMLLDILRRKCPGFVSAAYNVTDDVTFIPVSSLGCSPSWIASGSGGYWGIKPADVNPRWVTVPFTYSFAKYVHPHDMTPVGVTL